MAVEGSFQSRFCLGTGAAQRSKGFAEIEQRKVFDVVDHEEKVARTPLEVDQVPSLQSERETAETRSTHGTERMSTIIESVLQSRASSLVSW